MAKTQVEVITSVQRRRRWSRAEKERIVAATMEPGAVASEIARKAGIHTSQLFRWRQQLCERAQTPVALSQPCLGTLSTHRAGSPRGQQLGFERRKFLSPLQPDDDREVWESKYTAWVAS
jgi:transposase